MTFWVVMTMIGIAEIIAVGVLAFRRRDGRSDRYGRYITALKGFSAWTVLCLTRILLLKGNIR